MNALMPIEPSPEESTDPELLALAFGLGWASADEAHLPELPEALAQLLDVSAARVAVVPWNGKPLLEYSFPPPEERGSEGPLLLYEVEEDLGTEYQLRLSVESAAELSGGQMETLHKAARLILMALDCILVRQRDRLGLGSPFAALSDREWATCLALERPDGEKQIAATFACSRHTVHSYVKSLYRKLRVQSRLQMLDLLKRSRERLRRQTLEAFASGQANREGNER